MRNVLPLLVLVLITSCGRDATPRGLITQPGMYRSPNSKYDLSVTVGRDGIVHYSIADMRSATHVGSGGGFSTYQRWSLFWDRQSRLWTYNSDLGALTVWFEEASGTMASTNLDASSDLLSELPQEVEAYLPDTVKKRLKI